MVYCFKFKIHAKCVLNVDIKLFQHFLIGASDATYVKESIFTDIYIYNVVGDWWKISYYALLPIIKATSIQLLQYLTIDYYLLYAINIIIAHSPSSASSTYTLLGGKDIPTYKYTTLSVFANFIIHFTIQTAIESMHKMVCMTRRPVSR